MASVYRGPLLLVATLLTSLQGGRAAADTAPKTSPYTPVVLPEDKEMDGAREGVTHEVHCDDPLEKLHDCQQKARTMCQGDYKQLKITETEESPRAGRRAQLRGSTMSLAAETVPGHADSSSQRSLLFSCTGTKKAH